MADIDVKPGKVGVLSSSAFVTLGISVRASKQQILEAYDDRLFEGVPELELDSARSRLTLVRDRLSEELRFLSDLAPARAREALAELAGEPATANVFAATLPNLSRINGYADIITRHGAKFLRGADQAHREFDPQGARDAIDQTRAASGFPPIADASWDKDVAAFQSDHAGWYFDALRSADDMPAMLTALLETRPADASDWYAQLISKVIDQYDRWSEPQLVRIEEEIDRSIAAVRANFSDRRALKNIDIGLSEWDAVNQPVQLRDQSKGLDEPKSKRVFDKVRQLAIWLANEYDGYASAHELASALERTFPELPSVTAQLSEDLATLSSLVERSRSQELVQPLADIAQRARADLKKIGREVVAGKFSANGRGIAGDLYREHFAAAAISTKLTPPDLPWEWTRSVALDLNNEASLPHAAEIIVKVILPDAPPAIAARLREDLTTLNGVKLQKDFHEALQRQDFKAARALATRIIDEVPSEREEYLKLAAILDRRLAQRRRNFWFWGILAGVIAIVALANSGNQSSTSSGTTYDPTPYNMSTDTTSGSASAPAEAPRAPDEGTETPPPAGNYEPLSLSQLRYCKFEERRLDLLKDQIPQSAYGQFNTSVDDWNSRCNNSRFLHSYGETIDGELAASEAKIQAEVASRIREWAPAPVYQPAPTPAPSPSGDLSAWEPSATDPANTSGDQENSDE